MYNFLYWLIVTDGSQIKIEIDTPVESNCSTKNIGCVCMCSRVYVWEGAFSSNGNDYYHCQIRPHDMSWPMPYMWSHVRQGGGGREHCQGASASLGPGKGLHWECGDINTYSSWWSRLTCAHLKTLILQQRMPGTYYFKLAVTWWSNKCLWSLHCFSQWNVIFTW